MTFPESSGRPYLIDGILGVALASRIVFIGGTDNAGPQVLSEFQLPESTFIRGTALDDGSLYLLPTDDGLAVFSKTGNPSAPLQWRTHLNLGDRPTAASLDGDLVAVRTTGPVTMYDLADAANPVQLGAVDDPGVRQVLWHGDHLYLAGRDAVHAYDVSSPASPQWIGQSWANESPTYALFTDDEYLYHNNMILPLHRDAAVGVPADPEAPRRSETPAIAIIESVVPNPFNPRTTVTYKLAHASTVRVTVHDLSGRVVAHLDSGARAAGPHRLTWRGTDQAGRELASGVYFARIQAAGQAHTRKITLVR